MVVTIPAALVHTNQVTEGKFYKFIIQEVEGQ